MARSVSLLKTFEGSESLTISAVYPYRLSRRHTVKHGWNEGEGEGGGKFLIPSSPSPSPPPMPAWGLRRK